MITLGDCRTDLRAHLDESTTRFWTDAELDVWIWEAARDIARRGEVLESIRTIQCHVGQQQYDAPEDMIRIYRVEYVQTNTNRVPLEFRPLAEMDSVWYWGRTQSQNTPIFWSYWGFPSSEQRSQLYLYPIPSDTGQLGVFYYRLPRKPADDDDVVEVPAGWQDLIPLYAEVVARRKDNDRRWQEAQSLYEARFESMIAVTRQPSDQMTFVTTDATGFFPGWMGGGDGWNW